MAAAGGFGGGGAMCPHCSYLLPNHAEWCPMATPQRSSSEMPDTPSTSPRYSGYSQEDLDAMRRDEEEMETPLLPPPVPRVQQPSWMSARPNPDSFGDDAGGAAESASAWAGIPGAPRAPQAIRMGRPARGRARRRLALSSAAAASPLPSPLPSPPSSPARSNKRKDNKTPRQSPRPSKRRRRGGVKRRSRKKRTKRRRKTKRRTKRRRHSRKKRTKKRRR